MRNKQKKKETQRKELVQENGGNERDILM